jgi:hypothetical protein
MRALCTLTVVATLGFPMAVLAEYPQRPIRVIV